ncbi:SBBP repeat-containing protein [Hyalangium rubrum]|uniref:SBBP repeat-containing protein n=1 Tax=Hyalangium rubrum TaxID=3103134 RepID=A0ABU5HAJ1_9BACT|nr:SBBP repeat-containing protein [Hyalangium sp. s54d21]MDY7230325.1 SBBP repeat-containing protein [Hyalangium sp. s54d21]
MVLRPSVVFLVAAVALAACDSSPPNEPDSGVITPDAGTPDGGGTPEDGGIPDGGGTPEDGGIPDGGGTPEDGGIPDGGGTPEDGGIPDGGGTPGDGGIPDGGGVPGDGGTPHCIVLPPEWPTGGVMWGTENSDEVLDVVIDGQGNIFVAGYENGITGATNVDPSGDARALVIKLAPPQSGLTQGWSKEFDTAGTDTIEALAFHPDTGELYFAGRTTGAFPGFTHRGQQDLILGGPTDTSELEVIYQDGTETPQHPRRLHFDAARDMIVSGYDDIYIPSNYVDKWEDPFVAKLRRGADGVSALWWWQFNTVYSDLLAGATVESTGSSSIYITGVVLAGAQRGTFAQKLDTNGQNVWLKRQTPIGVDVMQAAELVSDGHIVIAGSTFAQLGEQSYGQQDIVVRKLDAETGTPLWTFQFGSEDSDWVTDLAVDSSGNILVVGQTPLTLSEHYQNMGELDVFLVRLSSSGELLDVRQWGSAGEDYPSTVAVDACGEAVIGGFTTGDLFGPAKGARDAFLLTTARATPSAGGRQGEATLKGETGWCGGSSQALPQVQPSGLR